MSETEKPANAYAWYTLGVLVLVYMLNFIDRQILSILANDIKADLGLRDDQLGFLYGTAFAIFYALFGVPLGRLADGWNRVKLLSLGLTLWSMMTVLSGFARNAATLTVARIGVGVGEASATPCAYSLIADRFPARVRGTALGIYSAGLFAGSGLSLLIGGSIVQAWNQAWPDGGPLGLVGWQAAFIAVGLPGLVLAAWVYSLREPVRGELDGMPSEGDAHPWRVFGEQLFQLIPPLTVFDAARRGPRALAVNLAGAAIIAALAFLSARATGNAPQFLFLGIGFYAVFSWACALRQRDPAIFALTWASPAFMGIVIAYAADCFLGYAVSYWGAPYVERVFEVDKAMLGLMIGAPGALGGFLGAVFGGKLADVLQARFAGGRIMVLAIPLVLSVPIMLVGFSTANLTLFYVLAFAFQFVTASALGAAAASSQSLVLPRMRGVATGIFFLGTALLGLGLGPFMAGFVSEATGNLATGVKSTLVAVPIGLVAMAIAIRAAPKAAATLRDRARAAGEPI